MVHAWKIVGLVSIPMKLDKTCMSRYVISLLANLNARGPSSSEVHMDDITTPQITVGPSSQQCTRGEIPTLLRSSSFIVHRSSVANITAHKRNPTDEEEQNSVTDSNSFSIRSDVEETSSHYVSN
jgi:hypothetical protein